MAESLAGEKVDYSVVVRDVLWVVDLVGEKVASRVVEKVASRVVEKVASRVVSLVLYLAANWDVEKVALSVVY